MKFIYSLLALSLLISFIACSNKEESARKMYNKALTLQQVGKNEEANKIVQDIVRKYPETQTAVELNKKLLAIKEETERLNSGNERLSNTKIINTIPIQKQNLEEPKPRQNNDPIPREEFIKITEEIINIIDQLESIFASFQPKVFEVRPLVQKLDAAQKKYKRYGDSLPEDNVQGKIAKAILTANFYYEIMLFSGSYSSPSGDKDYYSESKRAAKEVRELFSSYLKF
jgi:hypothetical protein